MGSEVMSRVLSLYELYFGHMLLMLVYGGKKNNFQSDGMLAIELFKLEPDFISFEAGVVNNSVDSACF